MLRKYYLISFILALTLTGCYSDDRLHLNPDNLFFNLDFENDIPETDYPQAWGFMYSNTKVIDEGSNKYLELNTHNKLDSRGINITNIFPKNIPHGEKMELKVRMKTKSVIDGYAGIWYYTINESGIASSGNMAKERINGSRDWQTASLTINLNDSIQELAFGCELIGRGVAYFDDFEIYIDGKKFIDGTPPTEPTKQEKKWLKEHIYPLKTCNPFSGSDNDLDILDKLIGDAKVIGLGEPTHGTREVFLMKHRIIKYLASKRNFNVVSLEANMVEAEKTNQAIREKRAIDITEEGIGGWAYKTQEVAIMIDWMRSFYSAENKIQFTAFDIHTYKDALNKLSDDLKDNKKLINTIQKLAQELEAQPYSDESKEIISELLDKISLEINNSEINQEEKDWLVQCAKIIEQDVYNVGAIRDKYMADNVLWIKDQNPDSGIILWAHNRHVHKKTYLMGNHLAKDLGDDFLSIGFAFHEGRYSAVDHLFPMDWIKEYPALKSYPGTYEYYFNSVNEPIFILDLREAKKDASKNSEWLRTPQNFRGVGAYYSFPYEFYKTNLTDDYDLIVFINKTSASEMLPY